MIHKHITLKFDFAVTLKSCERYQYKCGFSILSNVPTLTDTWTYNQSPGMRQVRVILRNVGMPPHLIKKICVKHSFFTFTSGLIHVIRRFTHFVEGVTEWMNERMNEWKNERMKERTNEWINESMNEWINQLIKQSIN